MTRTTPRASRRAAVLPLLMCVLAAPACAQAPHPADAIAADAIAAGTFAYDRAAPLELRDSLESVENGVETHAISYASPKGGRVTGLMFVPQGGGRKAGIVNIILGLLTGLSLVVLGEFVTQSTTNSALTAVGGVMKIAGYLVMLASVVFGRWRR